jgi:hypothetical protein
MDSKLELTPAEYRALLRRDFYAFVQRCFGQLYPHAEFQPNWHIEVMACRLEACRLGKSRRNIINLPLCHLKSLCASIATARSALARGVPARAHQR